MKLAFYDDLMTHILDFTWKMQETTMYWFFFFKSDIAAFTISRYSTSFSFYTIYVGYFVLVLLSHCVLKAANAPCLRGRCTGRVRRWRRRSTPERVFVWRWTERCTARWRRWERCTRSAEERVSQTDRSEAGSQNHLQTTTNTQN